MGEPCDPRIIRRLLKVPFSQGATSLDLRFQPRTVRAEFSRVEVLPSDLEVVENDFYNNRRIYQRPELLAVVVEEEVRGGAGTLACLLARTVLRFTSER